MARPIRESSIVTDADLPAANPVVLAEIGHAQTQISQNTLALADQLGYDGSLTVGALEDEIRFYQRRSVEAILALGTRLALLKEMSPHGEFARRIELLGFSYRTAARFMQAALKTSKSATVAYLADQISNSGKFLELVTLDDDDLAALKDGGTLAGLTLDDVEKMSVSELRASLREARAESQAKDRVLEQNQAKINELAVKAEKRKTSPSPLTESPWPEQIDGLKDDLHALGKVMDEVLSKHLTLIEATDLVYQQMDETDPAHEQYKGVVFRMAEQIERLCTLAAGLRNQFGLTLSGYIDMDKTYILPYEQD